MDKTLRKYCKRVNRYQEKWVGPAGMNGFCWIMDSRVKISPQEEGNGENFPDPGAVLGENKRLPRSVSLNNALIHAS